MKRPGLEPEARKLIELAIEAQKSGRMPGLEVLGSQFPVLGSAEDAGADAEDDDADDPHACEGEPFIPGVGFGGIHEE